MASLEETKQAILQLASKVDVAKLQRLEQLQAELKTLDELLGHNAETARDQMKTKADTYLGSLPSSMHPAILDVLTRIDVEAAIVGLRLTEYQLPAKVLLCIHIDDFLESKSDIPLLAPGAPATMQKFLDSNDSVHLVVMSHDSADVTAVLTAALTGHDAVERGQVSMVYESGLGLYMGAPTRQKKDYTTSMRSELIHILERMAVVAATRVSDAHFKQRFFFSASEFSIGIRVHPYARTITGNLDKEAAHELIQALAVALSDLVKEDLQAVGNHALNYFLSQDPSLQEIFSPSHDERVWDMEKVDELLKLLRFVHLGARGSLIRPADASDVEAATTLFEAFGRDRMLIVASDNHFTFPLLEWALQQKHGFISCSDQAEKSVRDLVETKGGIQFTHGHIEELLNVVDAYVHFKSVLK